MFGVALVMLIGYALLTGATGLRIILLARRTRQLPEIALGFSYLFGGMLGWALLLGGGTIVILRPDHAVLGRRLQFVGLFCFSSGTLAIALFSWRVFAPRSSVLAGLFFVLVTVLIADFVHNAILTASVFPPTTDFWYWPGAMGRSACYIWMTIAALHYYSKLRKRLRLGLADPIVANRVLLWGVLGSLTLLSAILACAASILDIWISHGPVLFLLTSALSTAGASLGWLAFLPPKRYLRWVESRAPKAAE